MRVQQMIINSDLSKIQDKIRPTCLQTKERIPLLSKFPT